MTQTAVSTRKPRTVANPGTPPGSHPRRVTRTTRTSWPPLENGDRLSRREFHKRYLRYPEDVKAELVEGTVYMASPVRVEHASSHADLIIWLGQYRSLNPNVTLYDNVTVMLDDENEVQPDAVVRLASQSGGQARIVKGYVVGPPELVIEVAGSSVSKDIHQKREAYRRNGVQEYLVWRVYDHEIDWWRLVDGQYVAIEPDENGIYRSHVFPGLVLDAAALIDGDVVRLTAVQRDAVKS